MENVCIIGSGISGLAFALALLRCSTFNGSISIFERDVSFASRRQGYGLTIQQGGPALKTLGIQQAVAAIDTPSSSHYVFNTHGQIIEAFGRAFYENTQTAVGQYNLHLPRETLRRLLYEALIKEEKFSSCVQIYWNKQFHYFIEGEGEDNNDNDNDSSSSNNNDGSDNSGGKNRCQVLFTDGSEVTCNVLVGADGIYSGIRRQLLNGDSDLNYLECVVVLGIVEWESDLVKERIWETVDGRTRLFIMPYSINPHTIMWQLSYKQSDKIQAMDELKMIKETLLDLCKEWHYPVKEIIQATPDNLILGTLVYDRDISTIERSTICSNSVVLIGDALHPMSPFKAQGANQALLDAIELASALTSECAHLSNDGVAEAIKQFTVKSLKRSQPKAEASRKRAFEYHSAKIIEGKAPLSLNVDVSAFANTSMLDSVMTEFIRNREYNRKNK